MKPLNLAIICVALLTAGVLFYPTLYRYDKTTNMMGQTIPIRINRLTGHTETFILGEWISGKKNSESPQEEIYKKLPTSDIAKLTGNASLSYGKFQGKIYNGSDWTIKEIVCRVIAKEKDGSVRWDRKFLVSFYLMLYPLRTEFFSVDVTGEEGIGSYDWNIIEAKGYKL